VVLVDDCATLFGITMLSAYIALLVTINRVRNFASQLPVHCGGVLL
jgi:hypothetical protein